MHWHAFIVSFGLTIGNSWGNVGCPLLHHPIDDIDKTAHNTDDGLMLGLSFRHLLSIVVIKDWGYWSVSVPATADMTGGKVMEQAVKLAVSLPVAELFVLVAR